MENSPRRNLPTAVLVLAVLGGLVLTVFAWGLLREYGETDSSGALQGLRLTFVPGAVLLTLAVVAALVLRTNVAAVLLGAVVVLTLVGPAVAGELAVRAKVAGLPLAAPCLLEDPEEDGSVDPAAAAAAARAQAAFDALDHPAPFTGGGSTGVGGCTAPLATTDLAAALAFYRAELPAAGWTIVEDDDAHLVATSGDLTLTVETEAGGEPGRANVQVTIAAV